MMAQLGIVVPAGRGASLAATLRRFWRASPPSPSPPRACRWPNKCPCEVDGTPDGAVSSCAKPERDLPTPPPRAQDRPDEEEQRGISGQGLAGLAGRRVLWCVTNGVFVMPHKCLPHNGAGLSLLRHGDRPGLWARASGKPGQVRGGPGRGAVTTAGVPRPSNPLEKRSCALPGGPCDSAGLGGGSAEGAALPGERAGGSAVLLGPFAAIRCDTNDPPPLWGKL